MSTNKLVSHPLDCSVGPDDFLAYHGAHNDSIPGAATLPVGAVVLGRRVGRLLRQRR